MDPLLHSWWLLVLTGPGQLGGVTGTDNNVLSELHPQNFLFILHGLGQLDAEMVQIIDQTIHQCVSELNGRTEASDPVLQAKLTALAHEFV